MGDKWQARLLLLYISLQSSQPGYRYRFVASQMGKIAVVRVRIMGHTEKCWRYKMLFLENCSFVAVIYSLTLNIVCHSCPSLVTCHLSPDCERRFRVCTRVSNDMSIIWPSTWGGYCITEILKRLKSESKVCCMEWLKPLLQLVIIGRICKSTLNWSPLRNFNCLNPKKKLPCQTIFMATRI